MLLALVPELEHARGEITVLAIFVTTALIGSIAWEDAVRLARTRAEMPPQTPEENMREVVLTILDELLPQRMEKKDG